MVKVTSAALATTAVVCGSWRMAKVFVPSSAPTTSSSSTALRGADVAASNAAAETTSMLPLCMGAAGTLALAATATRSRASRTVCKAAAAAETDAPPPPFEPAKQYGVTAPLGFFDPLGFSKVGDEEGFRNLRAAERKHGRVAMMAAVGAVVQHYIQFPGFSDGPKGLGVLTTTPGMTGMAVLTAICGVMELLVWKDSANKEPGDYGNPLSLEYKPTGEPVDIGAGPRDRELNNGRMAMISILGIVVAELVTGKDAVQQFF